MTITLKQYWEELDKSIKDFEKTNEVKAQDKQDEQSYQNQLKFLKSMLALGLKIENENLFFKKADSEKLSSLPKKTFGENEVETSFGGPKSVIFAQQVYLPYLKRFAEVSLDDQNIAIRALGNLPLQHKNAASLAERLSKAIEVHQTTNDRSLPGIV